MPHKHADLVRLIDIRIERALRRLRLGGIRGEINRIDASDPARLKAYMTGLVTDSEQEQTRPARLIQHYGLASRPREGTETIGLPIGGRSGPAVIIGTESPTARPELQDGEVALYDHLGQLVQLNDDGTIAVKAVGNLRLNEGTKSAAAAGDACTFALTAPAGGGTVTGTIEIGPVVRSVKVP